LKCQVEQPQSSFKTFSHFFHYLLGMLLIKKLLLQPPKPRYNFTAVLFSTAGPGLQYKKLQKRQVLTSLVTHPTQFFTALFSKFCSFDQNVGKSVGRCFWYWSLSTVSCLFLSWNDL